MMNYLFVLTQDSMFGAMAIAPGIVYVATSLAQCGVRVHGLHLNFEADPDEALARAIAAHEIDVVCIGALSEQFRLVKNVIEKVRRINPRIVTVVGGGLISAEPEVAFPLTGADIGVIGQGEETIKALHRALESRAPLDEVDGLVFSRDGQLVTTKPRAEIANLDDVPLPDYTLFDYPELPVYRLHAGGKQRRAVNIVASRSCPFNCTFCYHPSGERYRRRSLDNIFWELSRLRETHAFDHVCIIDELFAANKNRVRAFCDRIARLDLTYSVQLRVDKVDAELLGLLKRTGCIVVGYGFESADPRILKSMRKNITVDQIEDAIRKTKDAGLFIQGGLIFGDVEETRETADNTLRWWLKHLDFGINLGMIRVYPGAALYRHAVRTGIIADKARFLEQGCPTINISKMTDAEVKALTEKITFLSEEFVGRPLTLAVERINADGSYDLKAECLHCGHVNRFENVRFQYKSATGAAALSCAACYQKMKARPSGAVSKQTYKAILDSVLERFFKDTLDRTSRVALWGVTEKATALLMGSETLRNRIVKIVDRDYRIKHGKYLGRWEVERPESLKEAAIDALLITAPGYEAEIRETVRAMGLEVSILEI